MASFATTDQLEAYLGEALDSDREQAVLNAASAAIRAYTGQLLDYVVDDTVTLDVDQLNQGTNNHHLYVRGGEIFLPQSPVISVSSVQLSLAWNPSTTALADGVDFNWYPDGRLRVYQYGWAERLTVTYTHGLNPIPDDLIYGACLPYAARMISNQQGLVGKTRGTVIDMYSSAPVSLYPAEMAVLDQYRTVVVA